MLEGVSGAFQQLSADVSWVSMHFMWLHVECQVLFSGSQRFLRTPQVILNGSRGSQTRFRRAKGVSMMGHFRWSKGVS